MSQVLEQCSWFPFSDEPLVTGKIYSPKICDPQILLPDSSCDGKWHLFFHTWIGIHHYVSDSGIAWKSMQFIEFRANSPFIYMENDTYYLIYETHDGNIPFINRRRGEGKRDRYSCIEMKTSTDLVTWSKPRRLLDSRTIPFAGDYLKYPRVSRPQLVRDGDQYRLYFGASHLVLPDTKQKVSRYFGCATAPAIGGPYSMSKPERPVLQPSPDDRYTNLGCGSIRVVPGGDCLYGLQCGAYWDEENGKSCSSMLLLKSDDGIRWTRCLEKPILVPAERGWASAYIHDCDVHYKPDEKCWYCYFCASGDKKRLVFRTESIGLLLGHVPARK